jgi:hypothetical protein
MVFLTALNVVSRDECFQPITRHYGAIIEEAGFLTAAVMDADAQMERPMTKESNTEGILRDMLECERDIVKEKEAEIAQLRAELKTCEDTAVRHQTTAMRFQSEVDRLKEELAAAGTRPTWLHLREVEAKLRDAQMKCSAFDQECQNKDADICKLKADKDALRKAVEDGAMEIERLTDTLKGVDQIAAMKPDDVEMLKAAWEKIEKDGGLVTTGGTWFQIQPSNPVVDIKNDLSSAVANSTEGQRVVVEDLEATVEEPEWVTQDRVPARPTDERQWVRVDDGSVSIGNRWASIKESRTVENFGPVSHGFVDGGARLELRCRPQDLPPLPVGEDQDEWVQIVDPEHVVRAGDEMTATSNFTVIENCLQSPRGEGGFGGWLLAIDFDYVGKKVADLSGPNGVVFRCKRKDLPGAPASAESSP